MYVGCPYKTPPYFGGVNAVLTVERKNMDHQPCLTVSAQAVSLAARISALLERYTITQEAAVSLIKSKRSSQLQRSKVILCLYQYALFPIRVDGSRGKEKNFFSREKAERRHRSFLLSPDPNPFLSSAALCGGGSRKAEFFVKKGSAPY